MGKRLHWPNFLSGSHLPKCQRDCAKYCSSQVPMTAFYGAICPRLFYGVILWGNRTNSNFYKIIKLQKRTIRTIAKFHSRQSVVQASFKKSQMFDLSLSYVLETFIFSKSKCYLIRVWDIRAKDTRGKENYPTGRHKTVVFDGLTS